jgi:hypothetical protein
MGGSFASFAGASNTTGSYNIGIGTDAYDAADTETNNIAIGFAALGGSVAGGEFNVCIGNLAGDAITSGDDNVVIGYDAGDTLTTGSDNTLVGKHAGGGVSSASNCVLIGESAGFDGLRSTSTGDGDLVLGNNQIANAFVKVSFNIGSDMRDKTDIEDLPSDAGLNFINQIRPVTYVWDNRDNYYPHTHKKYGWRDHSKKSTKVHTGFVAQEIKELEKSIGWEDDHIVDTSNEKSFTLKYDRFVPSLVKAVQELSAQVTTLQQEINTLKGE